MRLALIGGGLLVIVLVFGTALQRLGRTRDTDDLRGHLLSAAGSSDG